MAGGLAFLISPVPDAIGAAGGCLGLFNADGLAAGFVAVGFDTLMDVEFKDINGNHVGLDLNSLVSSQVGDLEAVDIDLKSDNLVNAWIDYDGLGRVLKVSVSYSSQKPKVPILSVSLDLDPYVNDFMYVEFFGSTQGSTEIPSVDWWSFRSLFDSTTPVGDNDSPAPVSASVPPPPPGITLLNPTVDSIKCRRRHCLQPLLPVPINRRAASLYDEEYRFPATASSSSFGSPALTSDPDYGSQLSPSSPPPSRQFRSVPLSDSDSPISPVPGD
ncbi:L-type lectin-domain containing receptor kinase VIII.1 [Linum perenne]